MTVKSKTFSVDGDDILLVWTINNSGDWYRYEFDLLRDNTAKLVRRAKITWGDEYSSRKITKPVEGRTTDVVEEFLSEEGYTPVLPKTGLNDATGDSEDE
mgnify:CR=1 FL=1